MGECRFFGDLLAGFDLDEIIQLSRRNAEFIGEVEGHDLTGQKGFRHDVLGLDLVSFFNEYFAFEGQDALFL
ncbi:MAG: hypothetical protein ACP5F3_00620 [Candidatus Syntrophosphaera sp.]